MGIELDAAQTAVVALHDSGHRAVIGAAGTGKTTALVALAAARVAAGLSPERLRVLVPERAQAARLRDVLARAIPVPADGPLARTVDAYAFGLVQQHAATLGGDPVRLLTGAQQDELLAELLAGHEEDGTGPAWPERLGPEVRALTGFRTELRDLIARARALGLVPAELAGLASRAGRDDWPAAATLWAELGDIVDQVLPGARDSAELTVEAAALLAARAVAAPELVLVDDAQDLGPGDARLLAALAGAGAQLVLFGNPDAASGGFRGGDPAVLTGLGALVGAAVAPSIVLATRHRGIDAALPLLRQVTDRIGTAGSAAQRQAYRPDASVGVPVASPSPAEPPADATLHAERAAGIQAEGAVIARELRRRRLVDGVAWRDMAVVVRSRGRIPALERVLVDAGVPVRGASGGRALRDEPAAGQLALMAAIATGVRELDEAAALTLLTGPFGGLDPLGLRRLRLALRHAELDAGGDRPAGALLVEALAQPAILDLIDAPAARRAARFASVLAEATAIAAAGDGIEEILWALWSASGLAKRWQAESLSGGGAGVEADRQLDGVVALFAAARRSVERASGTSPQVFLERLLTAPVPEDTIAPAAALDAVVVTTPSALVGAEFDTVVVAGLQDGVWPNPKARGSLLGADRVADALAGVAGDVDAARRVRDDELRLFVLAATRASARLIVTAVDDEDDQPSVLYRLVEQFAGDPDAAPTDSRGARPMALRPLVGMLRRTVTGDAAGAAGARRVEEAAAALAALADAGVPGAAPAEWFGVRAASTTEPLVDLADPAATVPVSPSQIGRFETSPLHWFVDQVGGGEPMLAAALGTVVHQAMQEVAESGDEPSVERLWRVIADRWASLPFEAEWAKRRERRRLDAKLTGLAGYLAEFAASGGTLVGAEHAFEVAVGAARLKGSIDRIERTADGDVVVIDLKTGTSTPSKAELVEHPQLQAYQLAVAEDGTIAALEGATRLAGARLLYLVGAAGHRSFGQDGLDADALAGARLRVDAVARGMAAADFPAETEFDDTHPMAHYRYRIQTVPQVSS